jgi:DNA mismatch repair protein MutS2
VNRHALTVLEFHRVLDAIAARAASEMGREAVLALVPTADREGLTRELGRVAQAMDLFSEKPGWAPPTIPDARAALRRLAVEGSVLEPVELHSLGVLLASGRSLARELDERGMERFPGLASLRQLLHGDRPAEELVARTVDAEGEVLDSASSELRSIRKRLRGAHARIVRQIEAYARTLPERYVVKDASVTIRNGRYVLPLRKEGRGEVGGIVHDESATGATLFVEPPVAIQLMNELKDLERDEAREIHRVLREATRSLAPGRDALAGSLAALVDFDTLQARARTALAWDGYPPILEPPERQILRIVQGRHPLLLQGEEPVVPFNLELEPGERCLVVSGPNTGGKSVLLKAVGLTSALAQSGCVPPVAEGTVLPVFSDVFADIGDEQSIAASLSTFSAHLENLQEIVREADGDALVLIDEMGTGTDPAEGAALARALLEELVSRQALTVVTSHLGALKTLDVEGSGIVNASLQFAPERMEPTYRLVKGRPGRSYGLAIARRLGFPPDVLDRAEAHLSSGEASVDDLLETLEAKDAEATGLVRALSEERERTARLLADVEKREADLRERERSEERRVREQARRILMEAREEVDRAIEDVRSARSAEELSEAAREARRRVEDAARAQKKRRPDGRREERTPLVLEVGQRVRLVESGTKGTLAELREGRAVVETSGLRMEVDAAGLEPVDAPPSRTSERSAGPDAHPVWAGSLPDPTTEVDLRGLRVDEVELELGRALDAAVLGDLAELRIIHGKGTGAVRARVEELLRNDGRVRAFRLGQHGEGGAGVTVARVR